MNPDTGAGTFMAALASSSLTDSPFLYPIALNVRDRRCVVVGAGAVGTRKAIGLAEAGADVLIVGPEASDTLHVVDADTRIDYRAETFSPEHLDNALLVVVATDSPVVNQAVALAARERGVLVNLAGRGSDADTGDFAGMATLRRGDLIIGITTGGAGPALSVRVREDLEEAFGPEWGEYVALLGAVRAHAQQHIGDSRERAAALRRLAVADQVRALLAEGKMETAWEEAMACLSA